MLKNKAMAYTYCGFRFSSLQPFGEHCNSTTCRYVTWFPADVSEEERLCGGKSVMSEGRLIPSCELHKDLYETMVQGYKGIFKDKEKLSLEPAKLVRSIGVDLTNEPPEVWAQRLPGMKIKKPN
jgi:hypothetical protein